MNEAFIKRAEWAHKRVVITGGCGMVGSRLAEQLRNLGASVHVLDDYSRGRVYVDRVVYARGDAGIHETCRREFGGAFAVFNLAAKVAGLQYNTAHQAEMFRENVRLQTMPAIVAAECHVPHFLQVSSVCVYPEDAQAPCQEEYGQEGEPQKGNAGYAWAKRMGERACKWAGLHHAVIVRPTNMIGRNDYFDERAHVVPALIKKCLHDEVIMLHGTGQERREFLYADDAADGMICALERGRHGEAYTLGTDGRTAITMQTLAELIQDITGMVHKKLCALGDAGGDLARFTDCTKAHHELGWQHETPLADALRKVIEQYRGHGVRQGDAV